MLANRFKRTDGRDIQQERQVTGWKVGHGMDAILTSMRLFGSKYTEKHPVRGKINGKSRLLAEDYSPIKIGMIPLKLRINQSVRTLAGNGVINLNSATLL